MTANERWNSKYNLIFEHVPCSENLTKYALYNYCLLK